MLSISAETFHCLQSRSDALLCTIDARRISDGRLVHIKRVQANGVEHKIAEMLLHESSDNVMPVIDIFQSRQKPKEAFIVTPFLRAANSPAFDCVEDMLDCGEQLLEVSRRHTVTYCTQH